MQHERNPVDRDSLHLGTKAYESLLKAVFAFAPAIGIWYLDRFQSQTLYLEVHAFHYLAILLIVLASAFSAYLSFRCYRQSGEPFQRWLTVAFIGFAIVYAPHALFTDVSQMSNLRALHLYGPASRIALNIFLLAALLSNGRLDEPAAGRGHNLRWWGWVIFFLALDGVLATIVQSSPSQAMDSYRYLDEAAVLLASIGIITVLLRYGSLPLMMENALALALFAQSSIAFLLSNPWDHLWWYAHALFAGGVLVLNFGVLRVFHTTGSYSTVYSQEELIARLRSEKTNNEDALRKLQAVNAELAWIASTDALTGAKNRRNFLEHVEVELSRSKRNGLPISVIAMEVDHFKIVNKQHGNQTGDKVLKSMVEQIVETLRPHDVLGRIGSEEFKVLLPDTSRTATAVMAERLRSRVEGMVVLIEGKSIKVTVSIGVAEFGSDGETSEEVLRVADERVLKAKEQGQNCVVVS